MKSAQPINPGLFTPGPIGLVGAPDDPAAQLIGEQFVGRGVDLVPVNLLDNAEAITGRLLFLSQSDFIAQAGDFTQAPGVADVLLRRRAVTESEEAWQTTLDIFLRVIGLMPDGKVNLWALTPEAAKTFAPLCRRDVVPIPDLPAVASDRMRAQLNGETGVIKIISPSGGRMRADAVNWARLRRNLELTVDTDAPPDLRDLVGYAAVNGGDPIVGQSVPTLTVLFVVINGVGLGHLTRLLAIARELRSSGAMNPVFWCYSRAAGYLKAEGFPVITRQAHALLDAPTRLWRDWERAEFARLVRRLGPAAVVYDGTNIGTAIVGALAQAGCGNTGFVWLRRGMWQHKTKRGLLEATQHCDLVLEPSELAARYDKGATVRHRPRHAGFARVVKTDPVMLIRPKDMLSRRAARRALGIGWTRTACLVNLGGEMFRSHAGFAAQITRAADTRPIEFVWAQSPLAAPDPMLEGRVRQISEYPLGPYLKAFDGVISAAGYNSFHETVLLTEVPVLFVPAAHAKLDDQSARARYAQANGWADVYPDTPGPAQAEALDAFLERVQAREVSDRPAQPGDGVGQMCDAILEVAMRYGGRAE